MLDLLALFLLDNSRPCQQKMPCPFGHINPMSNRIPEFRNILPFVNQPWLISFQKRLYVYFSHFNSTITNIRIRKIKDTLRKLLTRCGLSTPFGSLNKNRSHGIKFSSENCIRYSVTIF